MTVNAGLLIDVPHKDSSRFSGQAMLVHAIHGSEERGKADAGLLFGCKEVVNHGKLRQELSNLHHVVPYRGNASVGRKKENQVPGECERGGRVYHPTQFSEGIESLSLKGFAKER